jgi:primosomal protein N''
MMFLLSKANNAQCRDTLRRRALRGSMRCAASQIQQWQDQREEILDYERQVTRNVRDHEQDNYKDENQKHQQFLSRRHYIPPAPPSQRSVRADRAICPDGRNY